MSAPDPGVEAALAEVLAKTMPDALGWDWEASDAENVPSVEDTLAEVIPTLAAALAPVVAAQVQAAVAKALSETADAWQWKGWSDVLLPWPAGEVPVVDAAQRVTDWLRARSAGGGVEPVAPADHPA